MKTVNEIKENLLMMHAVHNFVFALFGMCLGMYMGFKTGQVKGMTAAMEVYKGNTTLEYTIRDSVKVDSCVIFLQK